MKPKNDELTIHQVVIKFHITKVKKDNDNTFNQLNFDFFWPIFFNTIRSGTILKKIKNVIPKVGHEMPNNKPDNIDKKKFFFTNLSFIDNLF